MTSNQLWVPKCSRENYRFFPSTKAAASFMQHRPCFTSLYSRSGTFGTARRIKICLHYLNVKLKEDMSPTLLFFSPPFICPLSPIQLRSLLVLFLCHFVLWTIFFPSGHCPLPFVHNVRLFIFHSCLLPCLFYFFLPPFFFFFFFFLKDVY